MARTNQGGRGGNNRGRNNNPEGRNQYSGGFIDYARERPVTAAATVAGAVGAGLFLWARRSQISEQLSGISSQISEWSDNMMSDRGSNQSQSEIAEEAMTLKQTGKKTKRPVDDRIESEMKTGAAAY